MSDVMLCGVLRMPPEMWKDDPMQFLQVVPRMREAANELERRAAEVERLIGVCKDKSMLLADAYAQNERLLAVVARADNLRRRWLNDGHELREPAKSDFRSAVEAYDEARRALEGK